MTDPFSTPLAQAVAQILESPVLSSERDLPESLVMVRRFESGALRIVEDDAAPHGEKRVLLARLVAVAKRQELGDFCARAVFEVGAEFLTGGAADPRPPLGWVRRQRQMRRAGHDACPACASPIRSEAELSYYEQLEREAAAEAVPCASWTADMRGRWP